MAQFKGEKEEDEEEETLTPNSKKDREMIANQPFPRRNNEIKLP